MFYLRGITKEKPIHIWGGKRISEEWDENEKSLSLKLDAPLNILENILLFCNDENVMKKVEVNGIILIEPSHAVVKPNFVSVSVKFTAQPTDVSFTFAQPGAS